MEIDQNQDQVQQPIIIVKRSKGHHDEHHGGVWKIAFADFMTAMMAFFLVMWLINASNDETRSQVASYFNPVKLTDAVAAPKGVRSSEPFTEVEEHDDKNGQGGEQETKSGHSGSDEETSNGATEPTSEQALFQDPYAVLVEIAGERSSVQSTVSSRRNSENGAGIDGGEAFRDPFDPSFWLHPDSLAKDRIADADIDRKETDPEGKHDVGAVSAPPKTSRLEQSPGEMVPDKPRDEPAAEVKAAVNVQNKKMKEEIDQANKTTQIAEHVLVPQQDNLPDSGRSDSERDQETKVRQTKVKDQELAAAQLKAEIMAATETTGADLQPKLTVERTEHGLVVSLTDDLDFGMFASASARPNAEMVRFMDRIAEVLARRKGQLIVRGHTDSRPFRSKSYDNWRLSTARAHMAYHMLVRGGVAAERFDRIEGHADRDPRNTSNTEAAENRRIEILLVEQKS